EFVEPRYDDGRVKAAREVRIDKGHANSPRLVDQEGPRHRQVPRVSAVERGQIRAHLFVRAAHRFSNGENESKLARHLVAHIAQERKGQFQLLDQSSAVTRRLWRNRNERGSPRLHVRQGLLIGAQLQMAVRTPLTTIEG